MVDTLTKILPTQQYSLLKNFSSSDETDKLIISMLTDSSDFDSKEKQIEIALNDWSTIQNSKVYFGIKGINDSIGLFNMLLAYSIKRIDNDNINVGIRFFANNTLEYWIICEQTDYNILDKVYDIYNQYLNKLAHQVEFVFTSKEKFVGEKHMQFLEVI